jgi:hypothetical protein
MNCAKSGFPPFYYPPKRRAGAHQELKKEAGGI